MSGHPPTATKHQTYDVETVIRSTDLGELADELLGPRAGSPAAPTWPCPNADHPQTGRTPPVALFIGRDGKQRWHCHGCGNGGDAIHLVRQVKQLTFRDAVQHLAAHLGVDVTLSGTQRPPTTGSVWARRRPGLRPNPALRDYVASSARTLWTPEARPVRQWLTKARGLPENVLRANQVGADIGNDHQRPDGLRRVRSAAVLPVLVDRQAAYLQLRVLGSGSPKYLNPPSHVAENPRVGYLEPAHTTNEPFERRELIIAEGILDSLSAAAGGYRSAAILGASYADPAAAEILANRPERLVVAFDPDPAGRAGSERLVKLLTGLGRTPGVMVLRQGDLNDCLTRSGEWPLELAGRVQHAVAQAGRVPSRSIGRSVA